MPHHQDVKIEPLDIEGWLGKDEGTDVKTSQTWAPTLSTISVGIVPIYSRESLKNFSLRDFANGTLNKTSGIGFI